MWSVSARRAARYGRTIAMSSHHTRPCRSADIAWPTPDSPVASRDEDCAAQLPSRSLAPPSRGRDWERNGSGDPHPGAVRHGQAPSSWPSLSLLPAAMSSSSGFVRLRTQLWSWGSPVRQRRARARALQALDGCPLGSARTAARLSSYEISSTLAGHVPAAAERAKLPSHGLSVNGRPTDSETMASGGGGPRIR